MSTNGSGSGNSPHFHQYFPPSGSGAGYSPELSNGPGFSETDSMGMTALHAIVPISAVFVGGGAARGKVEAAMKASDPAKLSSIADIWNHTSGELSDWSGQINDALTTLGSAWGGDDATSAISSVQAAATTMSEHQATTQNMSNALHNMSVNLQNCKNSWGHDTSVGGGVLNYVTGNQDSQASSDYQQLMQGFKGDLGLLPNSVTSNQNTNGSRIPPVPPKTPSGGPGGPTTPSLGAGTGAAHTGNPNMATISPTPTTTTHQPPPPVDPPPPVHPVNPHEPITSEPPPFQPTDPVHSGTPIGYSPGGGFGDGGGTSLAGLGGGGGGAGLDGGLAASGLGVGAGLGSGAQGLSSNAGLGGAGLAGMGGAGSRGSGAGLAGEAGVGEGGAGANGRGGMVGAPMRGGAGGHGDGGERERNTWLSEDDDVWGGSDAAPGVIDG